MNKFTIIKTIAVAAATAVTVTSVILAVNEVKKLADKGVQHVNEAEQGKIESDEDAKAIQNDIQSQTYRTAGFIAIGAMVTGISIFAATSVVMAVNASQDNIETNKNFYEIVKAAYIAGSKDFNDDLFKKFVNKYGKNTVLLIRNASLEADKEWGL